MYNAYIDGLVKGGNNVKAVEIFHRMKRDGCQPSTDTYTMLINVYGKVSPKRLKLRTLLSAFEFSLSYCFSTRMMDQVISSLLKRLNSVLGCNDFFTILYYFSFFFSKNIYYCFSQYLMRILRNSSFLFIF